MNKKELNTIVEECREALEDLGYLVKKGMNTATYSDLEEEQRNLLIRVTTAVESIDRRMEETNGLLSRIAAAMETPFVKVDDGGYVEVNSSIDPGY